MELAKVYDELYGMIEDLRKQIGSGGGGGGIEINPAGSATADLEKLKKGDTIYGLNYNKNANRPQVNGNLLTGNKTSKQLNIAEEMTEAAYAALASKNENEIYFLTKNAPIFTETATVAASEITWSAGEDPDTYIATLSYSVEDPDTTGVVGVTCDNELVTIGDPTYELGAVSVPMICEDPTAITGDLVFSFTLTQPAENTRIVKNGVTFARSKSVKIWSGTASGEATTYSTNDDLRDYDAIYCDFYNSDSVESYNAMQCTPITALYHGTGADAGKCRAAMYPTYGNRYIIISAEDATHVSIATGFYNDSYYPVVKSIYGIKF